MPVSIFLFKQPYAIGSLPSLSGHAIAYWWRSLPRVCRHRASKPEGSSKRVLPWQITIDQIICASLSHTHYWYDMGMLKVPMTGSKEVVVRSSNLDGSQRWEPRVPLFLTTRGSENIHTHELPAIRPRAVGRLDWRSRRCFGDRTLDRSNQSATALKSQPRGVAITILSGSNPSAYLFLRRFSIALSSFPPP